MNDETWLNVSDAARAIGEHRQQLHRMLKAGRIPKRLIRDTSPPMLRLEGLAEAVQQGKRRRIDSRPTAPLEPKPPPDPVTQAQRELAQTELRLQAVQGREAQWVERYATFRKWLAEDYVFELLHNLPDPAPVGDVMVRCRETILARLAPLDSCETASRWPR